MIARTLSVLLAPVLLGAPRAWAQVTAGIPSAADSLAAPATAWRLQHLDGRPASLAAWSGRVLVVNLWATWCEPCVAELASLQRLARQVHGLPVSVVLVASDRVEAVRPFLRRRGVTLPVLLEAAPPPAAFGEPMLPTTWIIDGMGRIVLQQRGARAWDGPEMVARVRALAAGVSP